MRPQLLAGVALVAGLAVTGCGDAGETGGGETARSTDAYVVERSSENGVETVKTVSGSHWGGNAILLEELSIGQEIGQEAYLFGSVTAAWATDDRIYVIDAQVPAVRAFDLHGQHLFDVGGPGQGPGEYGQPARLVVTDDGRIVVADVIGARVNIYDAAGELVEDWPLGSQKSGLGLALSYDGEIYTQSWSNDKGRMGMRAVGLDGPTGELLFPPLITFEPPTVNVGKGLEMIVPFAPVYTWAFAPRGDMVAGVGNEYRFEIHRPDGKITVVERSWQPVAIEAKEAEFRADLASSSIRQMSPGLSMSSADVAGHKPAFSSFYPDRTGRVWVVRQGPGRPDPACSDAASGASSTLLMATPAGTKLGIAGKPGAWNADAFQGRCWANTFMFDVFDIATGDFLGTIDAPEHGFQTPLFADGDTVLAAVADAMGTARLKKYRLQIDP